MNVEQVSKVFISQNESPLDKRALYQTVEEFLSAPENAYNETFVPFPEPGHTQIITTRFIGQKVMIQNPPEGDSPCEYWFKDGIADSDFVKYVHEFDDSYHWEKVDAFGGGGSGGGSGGSSAGTVSLSSTSYLSNILFKSKVLGELVYFTICATISTNDIIFRNDTVGTLSAAPAADTAISVYPCGGNMTNAIARIRNDGDIQITAGSRDNHPISSNIVISGCFVTGAT